MKFGHLLKTFAEGDDPDKVCLNYKKLKKLIKAQKAHMDQGVEGGAPAEAASGAHCGASSDDEDMPGAPPPRAAAAAAAAAAARDEPGDASGGVAEEDREFIATLNEDLGKINAYFMEKEEDAVIRLRALEDRLAAIKAAPDGSAAAAVAATAAMPAPAGEVGGAGAADAPSAELEKLRSEMVDFHGELVLLLHWSLVNYAAVAKILKKHDKLTGSRLRAPVLASVLHQPFLSTESISQLVKAAERHVQELTQLCGGSGRPSDGGASSEARSGGRTASAAAPTSSTSQAAEDAAVDPEAELVGSEHVAIFKRTRAALHMLNDMQQHASTPSTLLPPQAAASDATPDKRQRISGEQPQQLGTDAQ